jgi:hypothetical protein
MARMKARNLIEIEFERLNVSEYGQPSKMGSKKSALILQFDL